MDYVRVDELLRRVEAGEDELAAFWSVVSDPTTGYAVFRGGAPRPPEMLLRRKLAALLARAAPAIVRQARDGAMARLARLADPALEAVGEIVRGQVGDGQVARARIDAARVILGSIGISDRGGTTIATQVNVEQRPRSPMAELLGHDPD